MTDNELLEQVFQPIRQMQVADDGFTDRVARRLPRQRNALQLSRLWTAFCVVVAVALFVLLRGWQVVAYALVTLLNALPTRQQLLLFAVCAGIAGLIALAEFTGRELRQGLTT